MCSLGLCAWANIVAKGQTRNCPHETISKALAQHLEPLWSFKYLVCCRFDLAHAVVFCFVNRHVGFGSVGGRNVLSD